MGPFIGYHMSYTNYNQNVCIYVIIRRRITAILFGKIVKIFIVKIF